jgi:hypothetical protein
VVALVVDLYLVKGSDTGKDRPVSSQVPERDIGVSAPAMFVVWRVPEGTVRRSDVKESSPW